MSQKLAKYLSIILGPQTWIPALYIIMILRTGLSNHQVLILLPSMLLLQVIIPLGYLYLAPKVGLATAWDLPKRQERYLFLLIVFITATISLFLTYQFGTKLLFNLNILLLILLVVLSLITYYWKISLHASLNTVGSILINFLFDWHLWFLYLTIPIIFWARLKLRKHTFSQLLAGIIISALFMFLGLKLLEY